MAITAVYVKDTESDSQITFLRKKEGNLRKNQQLITWRCFDKTNDGIRRKLKVGIVTVTIVGLGLCFLSINLYAPAQMGDAELEELTSRLTGFKTEQMEAGIELGYQPLRILKYWKLYQELESLKQKKSKLKNNAEHIMSQTTIIDLQLRILGEVKDENVLP